MSLSPGANLGHYNVTALIGEGGIGQAWQATDTQLDRQVALKVLSEAFYLDPDRSSWSSSTGRRCGTQRAERHRSIFPGHSKTQCTHRR